MLQIDLSNEQMKMESLIDWSTDWLALEHEARCLKHWLSKWLFLKYLSNEELIELQAEYW